MIRTIVAGTLAGLALTTGAAATASAPTHAPLGAVAAHQAPPMGVPRWMTRPCPTEDSVNCYWDAPRANGRSFYVRRMPHTHGRVCVFYVKRSDARVSDQCYMPR